MNEKTVHVPGISCDHCVSTIEREIGLLAGVQAVKVEKDARRVTVSWDPETTDWVVIADQFNEIHYPPEE
jgi:copper chaperone